MYGGHWFGGGFMWFFWIFILVIMIWFAKTFLESNQSQNNIKPNNSALNILNERYAKGEIEHDEFEQKKRDLES